MKLLFQEQVLKVLYLQYLKAKLQKIENKAQTQKCDI